MPLPVNHSAIVAALFGVSGFLGLAYEVLWQRQFALVFGSAAPAAAAVLAAYFAGLGLGSWAIGKRAARFSRPLLLYAMLEVVIGLSALLVEPILGAYARAYPALYDRFADQPALFMAVKVGLAFLALALPTVAMGATLPVLAEWADQEHRALGIRVGLFYFLNTLGAGMGALAVPLVLLPRLGVTSSLICCAAGSVAVAAIAGWVGRTAPRESGRMEQDKPAGPRWSSNLALAFCSGALAFALQVMWNRAFAQVHENSLYSFGAITAIFILALAAGAGAARWILKRGGREARWLAVAWIGAGLLTAAGPALFLKMTRGLSFLSTRPGWGSPAFDVALAAGAVLFLPVLSLGLVLPLLMQRAGAEAGSSGVLIGRLLAGNIAGSVVGALAAGFVLPSLLGLWAGLFSIAAFLVAIGALQARGPARLGAAALALAILLAGVRAGLPRVQLDARGGERLVYVAEGTHGIIAVTERPGSRRLKLNNYYVLGGTLSTGDERMQAHLPLLLHANPKRAAFLGLGTGISAGGALFHPLESIVAVELVPEVIAAAGKYFGEENGRLLEQPQATVVHEDARNYLRGTRAKFDVIVGDLVVPWREGEGALFTLEHFEAGRKALLPGGLFCVWLPCFQLSETEMTILCRTFLRVFPKASVWRGDFSPTQPAIALIGFAGQGAVNLATVSARVSQMRVDPFNPQLQLPLALWMHYLGELEESGLPEQERRINREDHPWIELIGPRIHAGQDPSRLLIGRALQAWQERVPRQPAGTSALSESAAKAAAAGRLLAEFALLTSEGKPREAAARREEIRAQIEERLYRILFPAH